MVNGVCKSNCSYTCLTCTAKKLFNNTYYSCDSCQANAFRVLNTSGWLWFFGSNVW
jgi:hypothetical protein